VRPRAARPCRPQSKRHIKRTADNPGGIISVESPLHYSNVSLIDPVTKQPVRISWCFLEDGSKASPVHGAATHTLPWATQCCAPLNRPPAAPAQQVRQTKGKLASASVIPRPEVLKLRRKPRPVTAGPLDTAAVEAARSTHVWGDLPSMLQLQLRREHHTAAAPAGTQTAAHGGRRRPLWRGFAAGGALG
jgi:large subunit ribosomal protein L24